MIYHTVVRSARRPPACLQSAERSARGRHSIAGLPLPCLPFPRLAPHRTPHFPTQGDDGCRASRRTSSAMRTQSSPGNTPATTLSLPLSLSQYQTTAIARPSPDMIISRYTTATQHGASHAPLCALVWGAAAPLRCGRQHVLTLRRPAWAQDVYRRHPEQGAHDPDRDQRLQAGDLPA